MRGAEIRGEPAAVPRTEIRPADLRVTGVRVADEDLSLQLGSGAIRD